jgi:hypothetical protein
MVGVQVLGDIDEQAQDGVSVDNGSRISTEYDSQ